MFKQRKVIFTFSAMIIILAVVVLNATLGWGYSAQELAAVFALLVAASASFVIPEGVKDARAIARKSLNDSEPYISALLRSAEIFASKDENAVKLLEKVKRVKADYEGTLFELERRLMERAESKED